MIIAMDGPASAGKSTLAVMTADALNFHFLNTGMIFRAIAYLIDKNNIDIKNNDAIKNILDTTKIEIKFKNKNQIVFVNKEDTTKYVSLPKIASLASFYSQNPIIREKVSELQHEFANKFDVVIEGRDIGTQVFPNADYKFFVTASIEERAKRRYQTLKNNNPALKLQDVKKQLQERDYNDIHRKISPLIQAKDAIVIDTSNDTIEQSLNKILNCIKVR